MVEQVSGIDKTPGRPTTVNATVPTPNAPGTRRRCAPAAAAETWGPEHEPGGGENVRAPVGAHAGVVGDPPDRGRRERLAAHAGPRCRTHAGNSTMSPVQPHVVAERHG
jgi:hypothetical protein